MKYHDMSESRICTIFQATWYKYITSMEVGLDHNPQSTTHIDDIQVQKPMDVGSLGRMADCLVSEAIIGGA